MRPYLYVHQRVGSTSYKCHEPKNGKCMVLNDDSGPFKSEAACLESPSCAAPAGLGFNCVDGKCTVAVKYYMCCNCVFLRVFLKEL